ncbi:MAG: hypothetical protein AB7L09_01590 [Nitrospira sp.]
MSIRETNQPLTELCERAWKLLYRRGKRHCTPQRELIIHLDLGRYTIDSHNRFLWIRESNEKERRLIFTVDEAGLTAKVDVLECAYALEEFRKAMVLDDLAEVEGLR